MAPSAADNLLYIADAIGCKVHTVNLPLNTATDNIAPTASWVTSNQPVGASVNGANNVLLGMYLYIEEYTRYGTRVRQITASTQNYQIAEQLNGALAVSTRTDSNKVLLMSTSGTVLKSYGTTAPGSGPGQMSTPLGLAVDKGGFILVCDSGNNRVLVLNPTLSEARELPAVGTINGPQAIWLDQSKGRLYIGEGLSPYRVLVYENMFNISEAFNLMKPV
jgi:NHL repeat